MRVQVPLSLKVKEGEWLSGRKHRSWKPAYLLERYRGFESHFTRQLKKISETAMLLITSPWKYHLSEGKIKLSFLLFSFFSTFLINFKFRTALFYLFGKVFVLFEKSLIFTNLTTGFWVYLKLACWGALITVFPLFLYFIFLFLLKGINKAQSYLLFTTLIALFFTFCSLTILSLQYLFPFIFSFFLNFENPTGLIPLFLEARFDQYLTFLINYFVIIVWLFLFPLIWISLNFFLIKKNARRRIWIYTPCLISLLVIAPPDVLFQAFLLFFLIFIIESLLGSFLFLTLLLDKVIEESRIRTCDE